MTFFDYFSTCKKIFNLAFHDVISSSSDSGTVIAPDSCCCENMVEECCEDCGVCPFYHPDGF